MRKPGRKCHNVKNNMDEVAEAGESSREALSIKSIKKNSMQKS